MKDKFYGDIHQTSASTAIEQHIEEIRTKGFTIVSGVLDSAELVTWRDRIDTVYSEQENEFGRDALKSIQELDVCRAPLIYDFRFLELATLRSTIPIVRSLLGDFFILNLQNAIINRPLTNHHQSSWHRDLPYQNWVISRPLAINVLLAIDEFSPATGGTQVVPYTHKTEILPSDAYIDANRLIASAPAGSAIIFDSMLFHRAGANSSEITRRAVNHLYTTPIIKQQYDFPRALGQRPDLPPATAQLLGYTSQVPLDDRAWRLARAERMARS